MLALLAALAAAPAASAQTAEMELWSATLTVDTFSVGTDNFAGFQDGTAGTLSPAAFADGDAEYLITTLALDSGHLVFEFLRCDNNPGLFSPLLELHVGTKTTLPFSELQNLSESDEPSCFGAYRWVNTGLSWSSGEEVDLRITTKVKLPNGRLSFNENDEYNYNVGSITRGGNTVTATFWYEQHETAAADMTITLLWGGQPLTGELLGGDISIPQGGDRGTTTLTAGSGTPYYDVPVTRTLEAIIHDHVVASKEFTVFDDDAKPSVTIRHNRNRPIREGQNVRVTVDLSGGLGTAADALVTTNDPNGRLTDGSDRTVTFEPGETSKTIIYDTVDNDDEDSEFPVTFFVKRPTRDHERDSYTLGDPHAVDLVITDTDARKPRLGIRGVTGNEGDTVEFGVYLDPHEDENVTVDYETVNGTAVAGQDYDATSGTLTIRAGSGKRVIEVPLIGDSVDDDHETFEMVLSNIAGGDARFSSTRATGTIRDNTGPRLSVSDAQADEGADDNLTFTVSAERRGNNPISVRYRTRSQTATANEDYHVKAGTLRFASGESSKSVQVRVLDDEEIEPTETLLMELFEPVDAVIEDGSGSGTIRDDDASAIISISDARLVEGATERVSFKVKLEPALDVPVTVNYETADGTARAGSDYTAAEGQLTFAAGETEKLPVVDITDDDEGEDVETFRVKLTAPPEGLAGGAVFQDATGVGRIIDLRFDVHDAQGREEDGTIDFRVTLTRPDGAGNIAAVAYQTTTRSGDDATPEADYTHVNDVLQFGPGVTEMTVSVPIIDDSVEDDGETFHLELGSPTVADIGRKFAKGTIRNDEGDVDDPEPAAEAFTASFSGVPDSHDGSEFTFTLTFSEEPESGFSYETLRDEAFEVTNGSVTRAQRQESGKNRRWTIHVEPTGDDDVTVELPPTTSCSARGAICTDDDEKMLSTGDRATVPGPGEEQGTSVPVPSASIADAEGEEGESLSFTVTLSEATTVDVSVDYATSSGTATEDTDFPDTSGTLTFTAGTTSRTITVSTTEDTSDEDDETFTVTLSSPQNATLGDTTATGTIEDDDEGPPLTADFSGMPPEHDGKNAEFSFDLTFSEELDDDFSYATLRDKAFDVTNGSISKSQRQESGKNRKWTIFVAPSGNDAVTVTLPPTTGSCSSSSSICTDDGRKLSNRESDTVTGPAGISVADATVEEADGAVLGFVVSLTRAALSTITIDYATSDGTATAGAEDDYIAADGTAYIRTGQSSTTIEVTVNDDAHNEGNETLTLTLSNPSSGVLTDATATGTIENHDPMPAAFLSRFGRAVAVDVVDRIERRMEAPRRRGVEARFGALRFSSDQAAPTGRNKPGAAAGRPQRGGMQAEAGRGAAAPGTGPANALAGPRSLGATPTPAGLGPQMGMQPQTGMPGQTAMPGQMGMAPRMGMPGPMGMQPRMGMSPRFGPGARMGAPTEDARTRARSRGCSKAARSAWAARPPGAPSPSGRIRAGRASRAARTCSRSAATCAPPCSAPTTSAAA